LSGLALFWWNRYHPTKDELKEATKPSPANKADASNPKAPACHISTAMESFGVARVYSEAPAKDLYSSGPPETHNMRILSQELFYQWSISLKSDRIISNVTVEVENIKQDDRIRVVPEESAVSQWTPKWFSGFPEPERKRPDYYVRVITLSDVSPNQEASITIRRQMSGHAPFPDEVVQVERIHSAGCEVDAPKISDGQLEAVKIAKQRNVLAAQPYNGGRPAPLARDPGDARPGKLQAMVEVRCVDDPCSGLKLQRMSAWSGFGRLPPLPEVVVQSH
jgi:hypothetical protein